MADTFLNFVDALVSAVRLAEEHGSELKVVRSVQGWRITKNVAPRGPWERFWASMCKAAREGTASARFTAEFDALTRAGVPYAIAAQPDVRSAIVSTIDVGATFFGKDPQQFRKEYAKESTWPADM